MKQTANKRQLIQDQVQVNNSHKSIVEGGLVLHKTQTTLLKSNNILKTPQKQIVPHNQTQHQIRKQMHQIQINLNLTQPKINYIAYNQ